MKIIFLLPPSEWKKSWGEYDEEKFSFSFDKPKEIAVNATQKDLKCTWKRYEEWIILNKDFSLYQREYPKGEGLWKKYIESINRYSWVMYNAIDYEWMNNEWKHYFEEHFLILSWMYWILRPLDAIWNYKLPIETKWLYKFWWNKITEKINEINPEYIVNLLPISYSKMIKFANLNSKIVNVNFLKPHPTPLLQEREQFVKISHWVKKIKWEWIKSICEKNITDYNDFWWEVVEKGNEVDVDIVY